MIWSQFFCDFYQFSAEILAIFLKTSVMITFSALHISYFLSKKRQYCRHCSSFVRKYFKTKTLTPRSRPSIEMNPPPTASKNLPIFWCHKRTVFILLTANHFLFFLKCYHPGGIRSHYPEHRRDTRPRSSGLTANYLYIITRYKTASLCRLLIYQIISIAESTYLFLKSHNSLRKIKTKAKKHSKWN
jgi:hypothetical protein